MPVEIVIIGLAAIVAVLLVLPAGRRLIATMVDVVDASVAMFAIRRTLGLDTTTGRQRRIDERNAREQAEILRRIGGDATTVPTTSAPTRLVVAGADAATSRPARAAGGTAGVPIDERPSRGFRFRDVAVATFALALVIAAVGIYSSQPTGGVLGATATPETRTGVIRVSPVPTVEPIASGAGTAAPTPGDGAPPSAAPGSPAPTLAAAPAVDRRTMRLAGPTAGGSSVRIRLGWELASGSPAAASFVVERQVGDGSFEAVADLAGDARTAVVTAPVGWTATFRITASAADGASRTTIEWPSVTPRRYQEASGAVVLRGGWRGAAGPSLSGGEVVYTRSTAARATFRFTGTDVGWIATRTPMSGRAEVRIDGKTVATVDLRDDGVRYRQLVFRHHLAEAGEHRLEIRPVGGGRVDIDGFVTLR